MLKLGHGRNDQAHHVPMLIQNRTVYAGCMFVEWPLIPVLFVVRRRRHNKVLHTAAYIVVGMSLSLFSPFALSHPPHGMLFLPNMK